MVGAISNEGLHTVVIHKKFSKFFENINYKFCIRGGFLAPSTNALCISFHYMFYICYVFYNFLFLYTKEISNYQIMLLFQLALSQKQLKAANEQISDLKERLLTIRESHDDIKEDFDKVSKEVEHLVLLCMFWIFT